MSGETTGAVRLILRLEGLFVLVQVIHAKRLRLILAVLNDAQSIKDIDATAL